MLKLHLGSGPFAFPGWVNYDAGEYPGVVTCNLVMELPQTDNTVDFIFTEHFIEHITRLQAQNLINKCYQLLKKGGVIRISTPNLAVLTLDYMKGYVTRHAGNWEPKTPARMMNEGMKSWGHQFLYDFKELSALLVEAGFKSSDIHSMSWHHSMYPELENIEVRKNTEDLILEAVKT